MSLPTITERIARLDELIIQLTKPPVTIQLRNQVWLIAQDFEAIAMDVKVVSQTMPEMRKKMEAYFQRADKYLDLLSQKPPPPDAK